MKLNIYVFEDQPIHARNLEQEINLWCASHSCTANISMHTGGADICKEMVLRADIFFFDIGLANSSGMHAAHFVRQHNTKVPIVFITNFQDYVFDGYCVQAFRYLLKPISQKDCASCMKQARLYASSKQAKGLVISQRGSHLLIPIEEILLIEAKGHYCLITTNQQTITYLKNFSAIQNELPQAHFIKTHRSFLVNLPRICGIQGNLVILDNGLTVPVSRSCRNQVTRALTARIGVPP